MQARLRAWRILFVVVVSLLVAPAALWLTTRLTEQSTLDDLNARTTSILDLYSANLAGHLEKFSSLPQVLSESAQVRAVLQNRHDRQAILYANAQLERFAAMTGALECYVMAPDGETLAASNWARRDSFVGENFAFRPYFQAAMAGTAGHYYAIGTTSLQRGYYFSYPVIGPWGIEGVTVIKSNPEDIEKAWSGAEEKIIVTDPDGVIFISGVEDWMFRTLAPLSSETRQRLQDTRRYPGIEPSPLPITRDKTTADGHHILTLRNEQAENRELDILGVEINTPSHPPAETRYLLLSSPMPQAGWTVHLLADLTPMRHQVIKNNAMVLLGLALLMVTVYAVLQRLDWYRTRITLEQSTSRALAAKEEALRHARDQLEVRVRERTEDLSKANQRLRSEIIERIRTEELLNSAQDELVQAGKLAAIGQLAAGITHEVNQPLAALQSYADNARILLQRNRLPDVDSNLQRILEMCHRIADISGHLKRFASRTRGEVTTVALAPVIAMSLELVGAGGRLRGISIHNAITDEHLLVQAETIRLEQVFVNLFRNAIDAMQDGDRRLLEITAEPRTVNDEAGYAILVRDSGPGLPEVLVNKPFQPFFSTKGPEHGLGLGLSISHGIIDTFGGTLTASNAPQGGALFTVWLKAVSLHDGP